MSRFHHFAVGVCLHVTKVSNVPISRQHIDNIDFEFWRLPRLPPIPITTHIRISVANLAHMQTAPMVCSSMQKYRLCIVSASVSFINRKFGISIGSIVVAELGLTSHQTHYRSYQGRVLWVKRPNQQCQSTEGREVLRTRLQSH